MARYKTVRAKRYEKLRFNGFLKFEARVISRLALSKMPYINDMIKGRRAEYDAKAKLAKRKGWPEWRFERWWITHIKLRFYGKKWKLNKREKWGATVAFRMLKTFEREYKDRHPGYDSPEAKRRKKTRPAMAAIDREYDRKAKRPKITRRLRGAEGDRWVG